MYQVLQLSKTKILQNIPEMDGKTCRILLLLACKADEDDLVEVIPSKLCKDIKSSKGVITSALSSLRKLGLVKVVNTTPNGLGHVYRICVDDQDIEQVIQGTLF